jgi:hypothetical protein
VTQSARRVLPSLAVGVLAAPSLAQQGSPRTLRFVPSTDLVSLDFNCSLSSVSLTGSLMVYDRLSALKWGFGSISELIGSIWQNLFNRSALGPELDFGHF